jgi:hypothetical protein
LGLYIFLADRRLAVFFRSNPIPDFPSCCLRQLQELNAGDRLVFAHPGNSPTRRLPSAALWYLKPQLWKLDRLKCQRRLHGKTALPQVKQDAAVVLA